MTLLYTVVCWKYKICFLVLQGSAAKSLEVLSVRRDFELLNSVETEREWEVLRLE